MRLLCLYNEKDTHTQTYRYLKEYKKQRSECGGVGAFTLLLHFMFFSNPGLSSSKVTLKAAAPPCHCWGPVGRREGCPGSTQLRPPLAAATVLALGFLWGQLASTDRGSLVALASVPDVFPSVTITYRPPSAQLP